MEKFATQAYLSILLHNVSKNRISLQKRLLEGSQRAAKKLNKAVKSVPVVTKVYHNPKFNNVKDFKNKKDKHTLGKHQNVNSPFWVRSRVFVNSKCKNSVNNVVKSVSNSTCSNTTNESINKKQVGKLKVSPTNESDDNRLCGNNSIKSVKCDASECPTQSHTNAVKVKVSNRFKPLSWVVNDAVFNPNAGVSNDSISNASMSDRKNMSKNFNLGNKTNNDNESMDYTSTSVILKQVEKGKGNSCMRKVEVEKIKDKCLDLKKCIQQQNTVFGFLPITNLKRTKMSTSLKPNYVLTAENFDPMWVHKQVRKTGKYNFEEAKIQLPSKINFDLLDELSSDYWDYQLNSFLMFGFPLDFPKDKESQLSTTDTSHASARDHPRHIEAYLRTEMEHNAIKGPYKDPPYGESTHVSPFMSREKVDSDNRRIIIDLSWPQEASINHFTIANQYLSTAYKLQYPTIDNITTKLKEIGLEALIYKIDLSRAFCQLPIDPHDYNLLCLRWKEGYYSDLFCPFGHRSGSMACTRLSDFFRYLMHKNNYVIFNYVDDLLGVGKEKNIHDSFKFLLSILKKLGFPISKSKLAAPSTTCNCLGVIVNTKEATLSVPTEKLTEIMKKCKKVDNQTRITRQELQSLLGSLMFIRKCVRPTRYFVNRLLEALRSAESKNIKVTEDMRKDIAWFEEFLPVFNGTASYNHDTVEFAETL